MARSENQGLQIAVIIFAFLTIALSVATFYFFNDASTQLANAVEQQKKATEKDNTARDLLDQNRTLRIIIGHTGDDVRITDVQAELNKSFTSFTGLQLPPNTKNYLAIVKGLQDTMNAWNQERQDEKKKNADLVAQLRALETKYAEDVKRTADSYTADIQRLTGANNAFAAKEQEHVVKMKEATDALAKKQDELTKAIDEMNKLAATHKKELDKVHAEMRIVINERYERENEVFERPDGMIVSVNAAEQTVTLNRGKADFLRLNVRFNVYKQGETNVFNRTKKGTIVVTQFLPNNMAAANIVDSNLKDPMLAGDVVATPTWTPGTQETFVLAGDFDINNDRKPDNDQMRTLVEINGGKVEEEVGVTTRYLLLGDVPAAAAADDGKKKYDAKLARAKELGIKRMGLTEFIEMTGSRDLVNELQKLGSREDTDRIMEKGKRDAARVGVRDGAAEPPRRNQPGTAPRPQSGDNPGGAKGFPPRRPGGIQ